MRIALLGAGGFIGSHLVEHLVRQERHDVLGVDLTSEKLAGISGANFRFAHVDVATDSTATEDIVREHDVIVDLIAYANPSLYVEAPLDVFRLNFNTNLDVVELCVKHGKRLIQYSTSEIYGRPTLDGPYREDESELVMGPITKQRWIYASAKQLLERVVHAHGLQGSLEYTILRPFNFIGPRIDYLVDAGTKGGPRVFAHFMSALLTGGPMYLVNGGHAHRSFTHIDDASRAFLVILEHPRARNEIFNVGSASISITIRELAVMMQDIYAEMTGHAPSCKLIEISGTEFYGEGYEDTDRRPPDISKIRALGWEPRHDLRSALAHAMEYYMSDEGAAAQLVRRTQPAAS